MNSRKILIACMVAFVSTLSFAQEHSKKDKINALKVAFLTEKLNLSTKEAQEFWPLYNQYESNKESLRHVQWREVRSKIKDASDISEKEAQALVEKYLDYEQEEEKIEKDYLEAVSKAISAKKTLLLLRSEEEFKKQLIKQYREKMGYN